jgi:hypothetical protein
MAHRILRHDRQQGIQQGWHGLTEIKDQITLTDNWLAQWDIVPTVLQKRGADTKWRVLECPDVPELEIGAAYNSETFRPITNAGFLRLVADSIAGTDHKIVSVGSVRNRGRVFLSIELQGKEKFAAAGREFSAFLNFGNGHDKSSVLWVNTSNTCTVCDNTFSFNLFAVENAKRDQAGLAIRQRHVPNAVLRFPIIAGLIDKAVGVQAEFAKAMDYFAGVKVSDNNARQLFAGHVGREIKTETAVKAGLSTRGMVKVDRLVELFHNGRGNLGENLADAVGAVSDFYTHESVRGDEKTRLARQYASSEFETGALLKREFYQAAILPAELEKVREHGAELLAATK